LIFLVLPLEQLRFGKIQDSICTIFSSVGNSNHALRNFYLKLRVIFVEENNNDVAKSKFAVNTETNKMKISMKSGSYADAVRKHIY